MCQVIYCMMVVMLNNKKIMGLKVHKKHIIIDDSTKKKLMKINRIPQLNIDEQQLNNQIWENIYEEENDKRE